MRTKSFFFRNAMLAAVFATLLAACKTAPVAETFSVRPPFAGVDVPFQTIEFEAQNGDSICFPNGTCIVIPANALADSLGQTVKGQVQLKFREFKSVQEIFIAGIPLTWQTDSAMFNLESAGMYEMRAFQNNNALKLTAGTAINVRLASFDASEGFSSWQLNEETGAWAELNPSEAVVNSEKTVMLDKVKEKRSKIEFTPGKNYFVFNYGDLLDMFFDNDWQKVNDNQKNTAVRQKIEKYGVKWSHMNARTLIDYKKASYYAAELLWLMEDGKTMPDWVPEYLEEWDYKTGKTTTFGEFKQIRGNEYKFSVKKGGKSFSCSMSVVFPLKYLFKFSAEKWQNNFNKIDSMLTIETERANLMADAYRSMTVSEFGIYNYDRLMKTPNYFLVEADFGSSEKMPENSQIETVFFFPAGQQAYFAYPRRDWDKFYLPDSVKQGRIVAVLPTMQGAWFDIASFDQNKLNELKQTKKYSFKLTPTPNKITSYEQIMELLHAKAL